MTGPTGASHSEVEDALRASSIKWSKIIKTDSGFHTEPLEDEQDEYLEFRCDFCAEIITDLHHTKGDVMLFDEELSEWFVYHSDCLEATEEIWDKYKAAATAHPHKYYDLNEDLDYNSFTRMVLGSLITNAMGIDEIHVPKLLNKVIVERNNKI